MRKYDAFEILGVDALFSDDHNIDIPIEYEDVLNIYDLRGGYEGNPYIICTVEDNIVVVNYCGTIITKDPLNFDGRDHINLDFEDWGFIDRDPLAIDEFMNVEDLWD